jgi:AbrB family looped-hinge helix DNA binding protein
MDDRGRLADRSAIRAADWAPRQPVAISVTHDHRLLIVRAGGPETITRHGYLRLPARIRHALGLAAGDRLLVTVTATPRLLTVYPMATVEAILASLDHDQCSMDAL